MAKIIKVDNDGHRYSIPTELISKFNELLEAYEVPVESEAYAEADVAFNDTFFEYMID